MDQVSGRFGRPHSEPETTTVMLHLLYTLRVVKDKAHTEITLPVINPELRNDDQAVGLFYSDAIDKSFSDTFASGCVYTI